MSGRARGGEASGRTRAGEAMSVEIAEHLVGAMHEGVIVADAEARILYFNARAEELIGIPLGEGTQMTGWDSRFQPIFTDGREVAWDERPTAMALRSGRHFSVTLGVQRPTGTMWLVFNCEPLFHEGEADPYGVLSVLTDITEHKEAELALARSEELKGAIMAASLDAILTLTTDGEIVELNRGAERLFKIGREAIGEQITAYIPTRDREVWEQLLGRLRDDPTHLRERRIEGTGRRSDGSEFPLEASINSLEAGEHQFFVTFVRDIADRKAAERRLADARDAALRASVVKSEFLATMSHEIRTPMNGVIGSLDLMLDSELAPELAELAAIARTAATDLLSIIDDILDLSKIEADKVERQQLPFDLVSIVEGVVDIVAVAARAKGVAVSSYVDPLVPAVRGDSRLLRQVLVNLAGNAVKFTDSGEVVVRAESQPSPDEQALVRFSVTDTGVGIPADSLETLFDPFTQVDGSSSRAHGGSGLGLAISSRLVRLMGGKLVVESTVGQGSSFSFTLPFSLPEEPVEEMPPLTAGGRPLRVLVVDPSETSAETVERYLRAWGMVPTRVLDAPAALERHRSATAAEPFDVAILAPSGGDEDLHGLARELRAESGEHELHVVALLDMGERIGEQGTSGPGDYDAIVGRPLKQARLHDALSGLQREGAPAAAGHEDTSGDLSGLRILIADDNPVNQQVLLRQAQRLGIDAEVVVNGQEVLAALERSTYDAVLMDCQMPVMDGYAATREIREREARERRPRLPIVAVTANAMREDFDRCRDAGMDDFIAKPVALAALAKAIERAVAASRGDAAPAAATALAPDAPAGGVDMVALSSLRDDLGGPDALARIVRLFLEQLEPQAEQIDVAARNGEHETLARAAHRMRSSAATLGATMLAELLGALEIAAHDADAVACERLAAEFTASVATTRATFETVLSDLDAVVSADG
ncbi:MAG: ATP-binding protein [Solirubrobacteraceae bacterium]